MDTELVAELVGAEPRLTKVVTREHVEVEKEDQGLLAVVECDLPVVHVQKILADIGVGRVGPASVISSMGRDTNKTIVLLTRDLFEHLEIVDPDLMGSITRVEEYDVSKCIIPNFKRGETFDIFCRLAGTRLTKSQLLTSASIKNDVISILEYMSKVNLLPAGSYFVDVPTPDRRLGTAGSIDFFFIRLAVPAHGLTAMKLKAFLNGHVLPSSYTVISTFWARGKGSSSKSGSARGSSSTSSDDKEDSRPRKILQRPTTQEDRSKEEGQQERPKRKERKKAAISTDEDGFSQPRGGKPR